MFYKKGVLKNFAIFTGKHLRQSLFLIKLLVTPFQQNNSGQLLSEKTYLRKFKTKIDQLEATSFSLKFNYLQIFVKAMFTVVKCNSKISIINHQIKFRKGMMNRSSINKPFLKILQYSQKNTYVGVSF